MGVTTRNRIQFPNGGGNYFLSCGGRWVNPLKNLPPPVTPVDRFSVCDIEADLPTPAWGMFAVVKAADGGGRHYFYVGMPGGWKRAELESIDD